MSRVERAARNEKSTRTNTYNSETGDLTSVNDSVVGAFTGTFLGGLAGLRHGKQTGASWSRVIDGVAGADMIQDSVKGLRIQITNLRGDTVAQSTTDGTLSDHSRVDEFGVPKNTLPGSTASMDQSSARR